MKFGFRNQAARAGRRSRGFTLIEALVAMGIAGIVSAMIASFTVYSARAFYGMSNYVDMDVHSRNALDVIGREMRQANSVLECVTNAAVNYITVTNVDALARIKVTWDTNAGTVVFEKTGQAATTVLTGCDDWKVSLYNRAPSISSTNLSFNAATNLANCKLINMSWKCSRTLLGTKLNTETVQTAQIVLRNKVK